ncbi:recombinase family protein [Rhizobium ruizarguesonis]|nr:recombinase family protein [Rhizobium ruizarguesonis]
MKLVGYARVSTVEQNLDLQVNALKVAGCVEIITDQGLSGADFQRPGLLKVLRQVQNGDMLVVWRLDRLGRSLVDLIETVNRLHKRGCEFRSLTENIDTSSSGGRLVFHMLGAMAEFERSIISERTKAGMEAAKARGARIGRRPSLTEGEVQKARQLVQVDRLSVQTVAADFGIHPKTLARIFRT